LLPYCDLTTAADMTELRSVILAEGGHSGHSGHTGHLSFFGPGVGSVLRAYQVRGEEVSSDSVFPSELSIYFAPRFRKGIAIMAEKDLEQEIEQEVNRFVETMAALNLTLSEDEIEAKRRELTASATGTEMVAYDTDAGPAVETWDQVAQLQAGEVLVVDDFVKLDDKSKLINVPFFIRKWWNADGEMGEFAVLQCVTSRPVRTDTGETSKVILTDGSTGIFRQLREVTLRTGKTTALMVRNGLRVSQYTADTNEGPKLAETYYLT